MFLHRFLSGDNAILMGLGTVRILRNTFEGGGATAVLRKCYGGGGGGGGPKVLRNKKWEEPTPELQPPQ